jgi:hypothetical protein
MSEVLGVPDSCVKPPNWRPKEIVSKQSNFFIFVGFKVRRCYYSLNLASREAGTKLKFAFLLHLLQIVQNTLPYMVEFFYLLKSEHQVPLNMATINAQELLFQKIREFIPEGQSMVEAVGEILQLSSDSAYRRIRGETPLVLDEVNKLCERFGLSLDLMLQLQTQHILFRNIRVAQDEYSYESYLTDLVNQVNVIGNCREKEIFYLTKDLPLFHNFYFEPLIAFRYFFWMKTLMKHPDFADRKFDIGCVPQNIRKLSHQLVNEYGKIPSTEIWNTECINTAIMQVEFYRDSGYFSSVSDIRMIYDSMEETLIHIKRQAELGVKLMPGESSQGNTLRFYYNRVILGDNTILVKADGKKSVYLNYNVLNYITTKDPRFCGQCDADIQNILRKSTLISQTSERQRNVFFGILMAKISERKKHLP